MARRRPRRDNNDPHYALVVLVVSAGIIGAMAGLANYPIPTLLVLLFVGGLVLLWRATAPDDWQRGGVSPHPAQQRSPRCVYMLRAGHYYKIGKTNNFARRRNEIALQLPFPVETVHTIATDDETALEAYWHRRFAHRRANGEWFELTEAEVAEFTQQAEMYQNTRPR